MKAQRLPQDSIVFEVIENFQEIIWSKIALVENIRVESSFLADFGLVIYLRAVLNKSV
jgi:hypothetical protein